MLVPKVPWAILWGTRLDNEPSRCIACDLEVLHLHYGSELLRLWVPPENLGGAIFALWRGGHLAHGRPQKSGAQDLEAWRPKWADGLPPLEHRCVYHWIINILWFRLISEMDYTRDNARRRNTLSVSFIMWINIWSRNQRGSWYSFEFWQAEKLRLNSVRNIIQ